MATMHASGNPANFRRSVEKYLIDSVVGVTAFPAKFAAGNVWWPGRRIDTEGLSYFLRVTMTEDGRGFYAAGRDSVASYRVATTLHLEVWAKRIAYQTNPYILEQAQAVLRAALVRGTSIALKDYDTGGSTTVATITVEQALPPRPREDEPWSVLTWDVSLSHIERDTAS